MERARTCFTKYAPSEVALLEIPDPNVWCCILLFLCTHACTGYYLLGLASVAISDNYSKSLG